MVIMKLFQQQNGNTCFIIVLKVSFMGKYANYSIKEMKWRIKTILFHFIFPFIKYKHCNIVTILSVRGRLILSSCTAHEGSRLVTSGAFNKEGEGPSRCLHLTLKTLRRFVDSSSWYPAIVCVSVCSHNNSWLNGPISIITQTRYRYHGHTVGCSRHFVLKLQLFFSNNWIIYH